MSMERDDRGRVPTGVAVLVAAVSVAAVLVAVVVVGGGLLRDRDPAPEPSLPAARSQSVPGAETPGGAAYAVDAGGDRVLATIEGDGGCGCTELWRRDVSAADGQGWEKVHEFPEEFVERLELAQDGSLGLAAAPGGVLWVTRDGGDSWEPAPFDGGPGGRHSYVFTTTGDEAWPAWAVDVVGGTLWRYDGTRFEQASYDGLGAVQRVWGLGGRLVVQTSPQGEGSVEPGLQASADGRTWHETRVPCGGENQVVAGPSSLWLSCASDDGRVTVHRFADTWEDVGSAEGPVSALVALTDDTLLLLGGQDVLVTLRGNVPVDTGLHRDDTAWGGTVVGEPGFLAYCEQEPCDPDDPGPSDPAYLATTAGLLLSEDGGRTWRAVAVAPDQ